MFVLIFSNQRGFTRKIVQFQKSWFFVRQIKSQCLFWFGNQRVFTRKIVQFQKCFSPMFVIVLISHFTDFSTDLIFPFLKTWISNYKRPVLWLWSWVTSVCLYERARSSFSQPSERGVAVVLTAVWLSLCFGWYCWWVLSSPNLTGSACLLSAAEKRGVWQLHANSDENWDGHFKGKCFLGP